MYEERLLRGFSSSEKTVCTECINDVTLREELSKSLEAHDCSFCGTSADREDEPIAAYFDDLMYIVMRGVNFLFMRADDAGLPYDEGEWVGKTTDSADAVYEVCELDVSDAVMEEIQHCIDADDWTESHFTESRPDDALKWGWDAFKQKVKYESRFVFLATPEEESGHPDDFTAARLLRRFESIFVNNELLREIPEGTTYWRGRLAGSFDEASNFSSAATLGPPPRDRASNNRMSPAGVSLFYGSEDPETVVAEIGSHSSKRLAVVAKFSTLRKLQLLDLVSLPELPSLYREEAPGIEYFERRFLRAFANDLSKPVSLDGREHIEYVPTQVVTEYLRYVPEFAVDGILFRSAQNGGINCILFCGPQHCIDSVDRQSESAKATSPWSSTRSQPWLQLDERSRKVTRVVATISDRI